jgi:hypothetical protein
MKGVKKESRMELSKERINERQKMRKDKVDCIYVHVDVYQIYICIRTGMDMCIQKLRK